MPHQCTNCGREFPDGSKAMLSGCPDCGGNKFRFAPKGGGFDSDASDSATDGRDASPNRGRNSRAAGAASADARSGADDGTDAALERTDGDEDAAQASARSDVVSRDELPSSHARPGPSDGSPTDDPPERGRGDEESADDRSSLDGRYRDLDEQFEDIKIVRPGRYELNLMELYEREEYIVSLQEDGRYVIEIPDSWRDVERDG